MPDDSHAGNLGGDRLREYAMLACDLQPAAGSEYPPLLEKRVCPYPYVESIPTEEVEYREGPLLNLHLLPPYVSPSVRAPLVSLLVDVV